MFSDGGRDMKYLERKHACNWRKCKLYAETAQGRIQSLYRLYRLKYFYLSGYFLYTSKTNMSTDRWLLFLFDFSVFLCRLLCLRWKHRWTIGANLSQKAPKVQQLWSCGCTMTTAVTAGICLPPHEAHFVLLVLLYLSPVSKSPQL